LLGENEAAELLGETLEEEKQADEKLTQIAESTINVEESEGEEGGGRTTTRGGMGQRGRARGQTSSRKKSYATS
jgi:hypothetical protein